jgi:DNA polymerase delta subunit OB-fold domain
MVTDNPLGPLVRVEYEFRNTSERFVLTIGRSYPQYASLYYSRLELMKPRVQEKILERWGKWLALKTSRTWSRSLLFDEKNLPQGPRLGSLLFDEKNLLPQRPRSRSLLLDEKNLLPQGPDVPVKKLSDLVENQDCLIIGTLYKEMELKPSILKEFSEDNEIPIQPVLPRYASEHDTLLLEEESQRIVLIGDIDIHQIVTGVTAALFGSENDEGQLVVKEFCFVGMPPQPEFPVLKLDWWHYFLHFHLFF